MDFQSTDLVLELGAGENPMQRAPNWHLHDVRWLPGLTHVFDLDHRFPVIAESYDGVVARYCLEHVSWRNVRQCIREMFRILKPGGRAVVITANLEEQCRSLCAHVNNFKEFQDMVCGIYGSQDYPFNTHKSGLNPSYAEFLFRESGFFDVKIEPITTWAGPTDMTIIATKSRALIS